jgi:hypothetical protein
MIRQLSETILDRVGALGFYSRFARLEVVSGSAEVPNSTASAGGSERTEKRDASASSNPAICSARSGVMTEFSLATPLYVACWAYPCRTLAVTSVDLKCVSTGL